LGEVQNPFDGINPRTANILVALDSFANLMKLAGVE
jgi:hypothetical protein